MTEKCVKYNGKYPCDNARHILCFQQLAGEKPPAGGQPFICDDHRDTSYEAHLLSHLQRLREEKRKQVPKARNTRSGPADLPMHWL